MAENQTQDQTQDPEKQTTQSAKREPKKDRSSSSSRDAAVGRMKKLRDEVRSNHAVNVHNFIELIDILTEDEFKTVAPTPDPPDAIGKVE